MLTKKMVFCIAAVAGAAFSQSTPVLLSTLGNFIFEDISPNGQYLLGLNVAEDSIVLFNVSNNKKTALVSIANQIMGRSKFRFMPSGSQIIYNLFNNTSENWSTYTLDISSYLSVLDPHPAQKALTDISTTKVYPSPSNGSQAISFELPTSKEVKIEIANLKGCIVRTLYSEGGAIGEKVTWDGKNQYGSAVPSGQYIARIISGNAIEAKKVCITK